MSRLDIQTPSRSQTVVDQLYRDVERRIASSPPGLCPIDMAWNFLNLCHAQTCGKCVPCRIGLGQLSQLLQDVLDGEATMETVELIERTAETIVDTADCAIGIQAARLVLMGVRGLDVYKRQTSICEADLILVMDRGRIIAQGTHQELMEHCEMYHEIYQSQQEGVSIGG